MEETYTFSRALHLMRYSGKKMQSTASNKIYKVNGTYLMFLNINNNFVVGCNIGTYEIMGSWVEVK